VASDLAAEQAAYSTTVEPTLKTADFAA
jgi:hypothetical protein